MLACASSGRRTRERHARRAIGEAPGIAAKRNVASDARDRSAAPAESGPANGERSRARSRTVGGRPSADFARQRRTMASSAGGTSGRVAQSDGAGSSRIIAKSSGIVAAVKGALAGEELVHDRAERPDVGPAVVAARRAHLLRRHVLRRAHHGLRLREPVVGPRRVDRARGLRDAEVEDLHARRAVVALREKEIRRLGCHDGRCRGRAPQPAPRSLEHVVDDRGRRAGARPARRGRRDRSLRGAPSGCRAYRPRRSRRRGPSRRARP